MSKTPNHSASEKEHAHEHGGPFGKRSELIFSLLCGLFLTVGFLIQQFMPATPFWVVLSAYITSYFFGGFYTLKEAVESIARSKSEIDFLMLVAAAGAAALGEWPEKQADHPAKHFYKSEYGGIAESTYHSGCH